MNAKRMIFLLLLTALSGLACSRAFLGASASVQEERTLPMQAGAKFSLDNVNGTITVRAGAAGAVHFVATKKARAMDDAKAHEALAQLKVSVETEPEGLAVKTIYPPGGGATLYWSPLRALSVDYAVEIPPGTEVSLSNINGNLDVRAPASDVTCELTNGLVTVEGARRLSATTVNGAIRFAAEDIASVSSTNGAVGGIVTALRPKAGRIETVNGSIALTLSPAASLRVEGENVNGGVHCTLGGIALKKHSLSGDLNGGGDTLTLQTVNGSIEVKAAS